MRLEGVAGYVMGCAAGYDCDGGGYREREVGCGCDGFAETLDVCLTGLGVN